MGGISTAGRAGFALAAVAGSRSTHHLCLQGPGLVAFLFTLFDEATETVINEVAPQDRLSQLAAAGFFTLKLSRKNNVIVDLAGLDSRQVEKHVLALYWLWNDLYWLWNDLYWLWNDLYWLWNDLYWLWNDLYWLWNDGSQDRSGIQLVRFRVMEGGGSTLVERLADVLTLLLNVPSLVVCLVFGFPPFGFTLPAFTIANSCLYGAALALVIVIVRRRRESHRSMDSQVVHQ